MTSHSPADTSIIDFYLSNEDYIRVKNICFLGNLSEAQVVLSALHQYETFIKNWNCGRDLISVRASGGEMQFKAITADATDNVRNISCNISLEQDHITRFNALKSASGARSDSELIHLALKYYAQFYLEYMTNSKLYVCIRDDNELPPNKGAKFIPPPSLG